MRKYKKITISIVILIILLISIILIISRIIRSSELFSAPESVYSEIELDKNLERVRSRYNYYIVKSCVNRFFLYSSNIHNTEDQSIKQENINGIINLLDEEYISYNNITKENITEYLPKMDQITVNIDDMYETQKTNNMYIYVVYGQIRGANSEDFSMIVKIDMKSRTFKILLKDYVSEKYPNIKESEYININCPQQIEANDNNKFVYKAVENETYANDFFNTFKYNLLYNSKVAYENLDDEYRTKRFPTFEEFEKYIKDNRKKILEMSLDSYVYEQNQETGQVKYTCQDTNGNYYIIKQIATLKGKIILDTYTLDLPEFITKYNESDNRIKVALNIEKIKEAINVKDYQYVYNKLDETFKNNNFKDKAELQNYLTTNLYEENTFEYKDVQKVDNVYIATVIVTNKKKLNAQSKEMQVIMKLTETTDYRLSFSFE